MEFTARPEAKSSSLSPKQKKLIIIVSIVILILASFFGAYLWQGRKVADLQVQNDSLKSDVDSVRKEADLLKSEIQKLKTRNTFLERALKEATASAQFVLEDLKISILSVSRYEAQPGEAVGWLEDQKPVVVKISAKNDSKQTLYISKSSFRLKDDNNQTYFADSAPDGSAQLGDQPVTSGETVVGSIGFLNVPKSETIFTLYYNDMKFTITAK